MKVFLTIYGWIGVLLFCSFFGDDHWTDPNENSWQQVHIDEQGALSFALRMKKFPNIGESSWIELEIGNQSNHPYQITNAFYNIELQAYNELGKRVNEGYFSSSDPAEIFQLTESINPFGLPELPIGKMTESNRLSALCTTILGVPMEGKYHVKGKLNFFLEIKKEGTRQIKIKDMPLSFHWWAPRKAQVELLLDNLREELAQPIEGPLALSQLIAKFEMPNLENQLNAVELLNGLDLRKNQRDGRPAIAQFIGAHFSENKKVVDYYLQGLTGRDHRVIPDLLKNTNLLQEEHFDALLAWIPSAGASTKFRLLELAHQHRNELLSPQVSISLSAHIQDLYGDLLKSTPQKLSKRELVSWAAAVEMWSYTGDQSAINFIRPFLNSTSKILGERLLIDMNYCGIPKPRRVNEIAMDAILRLEGQDLFEFYAAQGFQPPYHDGSASSVMKNIRKSLIHNYRHIYVKP